ncbi:MAG: serpin family protein [Aggregatilineales bacterium]
MTIRRKFVLLLSCMLMLATYGAQAQENEMQPLANDNTAFAFDLFQAITTENVNNIIFSPYSISQALAMVYSGANGTTADQMRDVLNFSLPQEDIPAAFGALNSDITEREAVPNTDGQRLEINIANALWGQIGFPFLTGYVDNLSVNYGAGLQFADFINAPEPAREEINAWVEDQTEDRIQNIVPAGAITPQTRLVLANAIYFNASWMNAFSERGTQDADFTLLNGDAVTVPMMSLSERFLYGEGDGYQALSLPYLGNDMGMVVLLPTDGEFETFQRDLTAERFTEIMQTMGGQQVMVNMPRFEYEYDLQLSSILASMGMSDAFSDNADFSGMAEDSLSIDEVIHKAFIAVDENGTEAAAATVITMRATSAPTEIFEFRADSPFIYAIYDQLTGSVLFLGRVMNPLG